MTRPDEALFSFKLDIYKNNQNKQNRNEKDHNIGTRV